MPRDLRAAYIASVQRGASVGYAAKRAPSGHLEAENEVHDFVTTLEPSRVVLASKERSWSLSMRTQGFGCEGAVVPVSEAKPEAEGNRVSYEHGGLSAWYLNGPLGLEQGFVVAEAPSCNGTKVVKLELGGDLRAELEDADGDGRGEAIRLLDGEGRVALSYADLFVKDADGKALSAWLSVERGELSIHIDDTGAAYPVEIDPLIAMQQAKLLASDGAAGDAFGYSVALSGDTALVGAHDNNDKGAYSGSAYVFVRSGGVWTEQAKLLASDGAAGDAFGYSVALSGDTALVGAPFDTDKGSNSGSAYVFVRSGGVWTEQAKLLASDGGTYNFFGSVLAVSGDTALVGAGGNGNSGSAYVFVRSGGVWTQQAKLLASDGATGDTFGASVSLSGDTALVGALGDDDKGSNSGSVYVFVRSGSVWTEQAKLLASDGAADDLFGHSVSVLGDMALVGAYFDDDMGLNSGSAYVFVRSGGVWTEQAKLLASDGAADDQFGCSVSLSGNMALVGAFLDDDTGLNSGSAYVFVYSGGVWTPQAKLVASDGAGYDRFGHSVSLSGDTALVGAFGDADQGTDSGSAYVFLVSVSVGSSCATAADCTSGFCADGVCCNSACGASAVNDCQACSVAAGAAVDGICGPVAANTECRASAGACDVAEVCDGVNAACPSDAKASANTECRASAGACDVAEMCDGMTDACPSDVKAAANTECRASAGACDVAEVCDGLSDACPSDTKVAANTECRASAGACDVAEMCDGVNAACPSDAKVAANTECRASAGACDVAEVCDGVNAACPSDAKVAANTECRASAGACDVAEVCDGVSDACPSDMMVAANTECRPKSGPCDLAEACNGIDANCPTDAVADVTTECRPAAGPCDIAEKCDGVSKACTQDQVAAVGVICNPAVGECDVAESCNGISVSCPMDANKPDGTSCTGGTCMGGVCMSSTGSMGTGGGGGSGGGSGSGSGGGSESGSGSGGAGGSPNPGDSGDEGGCGCRVAGGSSGDDAKGNLLVLGLGLSLVMVKRRRRR